MENGLRDYQREAVQALYESLGRAPDTCPLVVMPTGSGKSHVIAEFVKHALLAHPGTTILMATHVKELIEQNHDKLVRAWPDAPCGIYSAGLGRRDLDKPILFAGVQSIYRKTDKLGLFSILLVDEAHLIPKDGEGMYRTLIAGLRAINPDLRIAGFTATEFRTDSGLLYTGDDALFTEVCYRAGITRLIDEGWLSPIHAKGSECELDLSDVRILRGEFREDDMERVAMEILSRSVSEIEAWGERCKKWLVFCCSVKHAVAVSGLIADSRLVTGETPKQERDDTVEWFRTVESGCLVNVNVFTTGFDVPDVDLVVLLRATTSPVLYVQMVGRGMRRAPGKEECVVLDFGSNVPRHGPINDVRLRRKKDETSGPAPMKKCPECGEWVPLAALQCLDCGHLFPERKPKHDPKPQEAQLIERDWKPSWFDVDSVSYRKHTAAGKETPTVRVMYQCAFNSISEWVCPEHAGFAGKKAARWWYERAKEIKDPAPSMVDEFLVRRNELRVPSRIAVDLRQRWPVVVSHAFESNGQGDGAGPSESGEALPW